MTLQASGRRDGLCPTNPSDSPLSSLNQGGLLRPYPAEPTAGNRYFLSMPLYLHNSHWHDDHEHTWSVGPGKILEKDQYNFGFDAQSGEYVNMMSKGIIDPTKVVRAAGRRAPGTPSSVTSWPATASERPYIAELSITAPPPSSSLQTTSRSGRRSSTDAPNR
jgi:hypothetical protein